MIKSIFFVFIGGGMGSVLRFLLSKYLSSNFTHINPLGTLFSNILASVLLAVSIYYFHEKQQIGMYSKLFFVTGLCGGFSTFSTFSYETYELFKLNLYFYGISNILVSIGLGVFSMYILSKTF